MQRRATRACHPGRLARSQSWVPPPVLHLLPRAELDRARRPVREAVRAVGASNSGSGLQRGTRREGQASATLKESTAGRREGERKAAHLATVDPVDHLDEREQLSVARVAELRLRARRTGPSAGHSGRRTQEGRGRGRGRGGERDATHEPRDLDVAELALLERVEQSLQLPSDGLPILRVLAVERLLGEERSARDRQPEPVDADEVCAEVLYEDRELLCKVDDSTVRLRGQESERTGRDDRVSQQEAAKEEDRANGRRTLSIRSRVIELAPPAAEGCEGEAESVLRDALAGRRGSQTHKLSCPRKAGHPETVTLVLHVPQERLLLRPRPRKPPSTRQRLLEVVAEELGVALGDGRRADLLLEAPVDPGLRYCVDGLSRRIVRVVAVLWIGAWIGGHGERRARTDRGRKGRARSEGTEAKLERPRRRSASTSRRRREELLDGPGGGPVRPPREQDASTSVRGPCAARELEVDDGGVRELGAVVAGTAAR